MPENKLPCVSGKVFPPNFTPLPTDINAEIALDGPGAAIAVNGPHVSPVVESSPHQ
jgi:hypothetical protein